MKLTLRLNAICLASFLASFTMMSHIPSEAVLEIVNPSPGSSSSQGEPEDELTEAEKQEVKALKLIKLHGCWNDDSQEHPYPTRVVYSDVDGKTKMGGEVQVSRALNTLYGDVKSPGPKYSPYAFCE